MAQGRPWYKRRGGDFVTGTLHMPPIERLCYSLIIDMLNDRDRPLPDDPGFIAGFCGISKQKWGRARAYLLDGNYLVLTHDGRLTNPTFEREHAERLADREAAIEHGRAGGQKSAAMRAGQGELNLPAGATSPSRARTERTDIPEKLEKTPQQSSRKVATNRDGLREEVPAASSKDNDLAQPPPQAPCAREEVRDKSKDSTHPDSESGTPEPGRLADADLKGLYDATTEAAGIHLSSPAAIDRAMRTVEEWKAAGFDFDEVVIPTIRHAVSKATEPTRVLSRFSPEIKHQHAKRKALTKGQQKYLPPPSPILDPEGEDPALQPIRRALLERLGPHAYCLSANDVRLEVETDAFAGRKPLRVRPLRSGSADHLTRGTHSGLMRAIAKAHGFTEVW